MSLVGEYAVGPYVVALNTTLSVTDSTSKLIWSTTDDIFVHAGVSHDKVVGASGCWVIGRRDKS
eukprot:2777569-Prymnesium_polylepis.1